MWTFKEACNKFHEIVYSLVWIFNKCEARAPMKNIYVIKFDYVRIVGVASSPAETQVLASPPYTWVAHINVVASTYFVLDPRTNSAIHHTYLRLSLINSSIHRTCLWNIIGLNSQLNCCCACWSSLGGAGTYHNVRKIHISVIWFYKDHYRKS